MNDHEEEDYDYDCDSVSYEELEKLHYEREFESPISMESLGLTWQDFM